MNSGYETGQTGSGLKTNDIPGGNNTPQVPVAGIML